MENIYDEIKEDKINPTQEQIERYRKHLADKFETLRHIKDDDFFEWNHAMIVYLVISMCEFKLKKGLILLVRETKKINNTMNGLKKNQMLTIKNTKNKLSTIMLLIDHVDDRWGHFELNNIKFIEKYINKIFLSASEYVHNAGELTFYDRWNLIEPIEYKNLYRVRNVLVMKLACKQAFQTKNTVLGNLINTFNTSLDISVSENEERQFIRWAEKRENILFYKKI